MPEQELSDLITPRLRASRDLDTDPKPGQEKSERPKDR
jgi:hypothetical protein